MVPGLREGLDFLLGVLNSKVSREGVGIFGVRSFGVVSKEYGKFRNDPDDSRRFGI